MVRLQADEAGRYGSRVGVFQFLNGTITRLHRAQDAGNPEKFQFLNGTITSRDRQVAAGDRKRFQFLNGTITRWKGRMR